MASINDYGTPGEPLNAPPLNVWAEAVAAALDGDDTTVNTRIATELAEATAPLVPATLQVIAGDGLLGGGPLTADVTLTLDSASLPPQSTRVTHPNTDDVLTEVWDEGRGRWQETRYDSGWRNVLGDIDPAYHGLSGPYAYMRRVNSEVTFDVCLNLGALPSGNTAIFVIPSAFGPSPGYLPHGVWYTAAVMNSVGGNYTSGGSLFISKGTATSTTARAAFRWTTAAPRPTSLPGTLHLPAPN